jgi:hypothetical protein
MFLRKKNKLKINFKNNFMGKNIFFPKIPGTIGIKIFGDYQVFYRCFQLENIYLESF